MESTSQLVKVLKSHRNIVKVDLPISNDASLFWDELGCKANNESIDRLRLSREEFQEFAANDTLEIMNRQGRILKRFSKFIKHQYHCELTPSELGIIGDWLQYFISKNAYELFIDFIDNVDWNDGQFGKSGSCYWGCYSSSIPTLENAGAYAMRFYRDMVQNNDNGIGRTWVYPKDGRLYCFNSYGIERAKVSKAIKTIFAGHGIELHYKAVELENSNGDIPYINGGSGFCMYQEGDNFDDSSIDLNMTIIQDTKVSCEACGDRYNEDDMHSVNGYSYCDDCYSERFTVCDRCGEDIDRDDINTVEDGHYTELCNHCLDYLDFICCDGCGSYVRSFVTAEDTGSHFCENCEDRLYHCEECNNYYEDETEDECQTEEETEEETEEAA